MTAHPRQGRRPDPLAPILRDLPLRAGGFIVTLYGDVVAPRGGEVWIGNIIEACAAVGISETLVRTAVSRLVAAGQLVSRRIGRRGFYRLAPAAEAEFAAAARAIYGPEDPCGWRFVVLPEAEAEALMPELERSGHARLRAHLAFGPARAALPAGVLAFAARPAGALPLLAGFAAGAYDLGHHARAYDAFRARFAPLQAGAPRLTGAPALTARLALVHAYRQVLLRDPRLPPEALPADWSGHAARRLFARLYLALSPAADSHVAAQFEAAAGPLAATTAITSARLAALEGDAGSRESAPDQGLAAEDLHE
ncbi:PaaX family transcriptional regulator C-terminal domain-containing protein [Pararhodobacter sp. SW119]|uniref:PaaX family transcriptional regulator C-terminal domain-containing protein n=1 Tax=Pararhodobacter sp. SW119 TaxID=2780075 RepID=UPI001AE0D087|nr:PaaX family transcriptional regulator C-terminal domain-containing protein [Pararhodobacter sp. SW119]